jgi:3-hydroxybutyryl-CoA dehydrogenase
MMGRQIALNTAKYGLEVFITDVNEDVRNSAAQWEEEYLAGRIAKGRMTEEEVSGIKSRMHITGSLAEAVKDADLVIEAIFEDENAKHDIFKKVNALAKPGTILTTNSSTMVSSMFACDVSDPSRLANLHYFNPALVMELVEVVKGDHTSEETARILVDFCKATGKHPVLLRKEVERFVVNRIMRAIADEAC